MKDISEHTKHLIQLSEEQPLRGRDIKNNIQMYRGRQCIITRKAFVLLSRPLNIFKNDLTRYEHLLDNYLFELYDYVNHHKVQSLEISEEELINYQSIYEKEIKKLNPLLVKYLHDNEYLYNISDDCFVNARLLVLMKQIFPDSKIYYTDMLHPLYFKSRYGYGILKTAMILDYETREFVVAIKNK